MSLEPDSLAPTRPGADTGASTALREFPAHDLLFGRYRPVRELGRGGMGVVLLVHDQVLNLPVALKFLPHDVVHQPEELHELKQEVLNGMALTHPGIVRVFSFEQSGDRGAIVMEFVDGESLGEAKHQE